MTELITVLRTILLGCEAQGLSDDEVRSVVRHYVDEPEREYDTRGAAEYIGKSTATLKHWRLNGLGPTYRREGGSKSNVRYKQKWLDEWMNSNVVRPGERFLDDGHAGLGYSGLRYDPRFK